MDAATEAVELAYTMTADDIRHGVLTKTKATRVGRPALVVFRIALVLFAVVLALYLVIAIVGGIMPDWRDLAPGLAVIGVVGLVLLARRRIYRQLATRMGSLRVSIDDQSVRITNEHSSTVNAWSAYGTYVETGQAFVLLSPDTRRLVFTVLPKRGLADEADVRRLREILARHLG